MQREGVPICGAQLASTAHQQDLFGLEFKPNGAAQARHAFSTCSALKVFEVAGQVAARSVSNLNQRSKIGDSNRFFSGLFLAKKLHSKRAMAVQKQGKGNLFPVGIRDGHIWQF